MTLESMILPRCRNALQCWARLGVCSVAPASSKVQDRGQADRCTDWPRPVCVRWLLHCSHWEKDAVLYDTMIRRTRAALATGGALRAFLWYQGESDAAEKSRADQYEHKLIAFFHNLRTDLSHQDLPIIQVVDKTPKS